MFEIFEGINKTTIQVVNLTCPNCGRGVRILLPINNLNYKVEMEFWKDRYYALIERYSNIRTEAINETINR